MAQAQVSDVSFVIPSYRRPDALADCLERLFSLTPAPAEILVVARPDDDETRAVAARFGATGVSVEQPGVSAALVAGFAAATGAVIAVLDDDTVPDRDWLTRCLSHLDDPAVGMAGGRDRVYRTRDAEPLAGDPDPVGLLLKTGTFIGNHHSGAGPARPVDHLKGCNYVARAVCLQRPFGTLDALKGKGAQIANDSAVCLSVRAAGWGLVYDPQAQVAHYPAVRSAGDHRNSTKPEDVYISSFNDTLVRLTFIPAPWLAVAAPLSVLLGGGQSAGLARLAVRRARGERPSAFASLRGILTALVALPRMRATVRRELAGVAVPPG